MRYGRPTLRTLASRLKAGGGCPLRAVPSGRSRSRVSGHRRAAPLAVLGEGRWLQVARRCRSGSQAYDLLRWQVIAEEFDQAPAATTREQYLAQARQPLSS